MPAPGLTVRVTVEVAESQEAVCQALVAAACRIPGYTVATAGPGSLVLARRYTPTWARLAAFWGVIFFLLSLLALLIKRTEVLSVTVVAVDGGSRVVCDGVASREMLRQLDAVIDLIPPLMPTSARERRQANIGGGERTSQVALLIAPEKVSRIDKRILPEGQEDWEDEDEGNDPWTQERIAQNRVWLAKHHPGYRAPVQGTTPSEKARPLPAD